LNNLLFGSTMLVYSPTYKRTLKNMFYDQKHFGIAKRRRGKSLKDLYKPISGGR